MKIRNLLSGVSMIALITAAVPNAVAQIRVYQPPGIPQIPQFPTGACCRSDGSCSITTSLGCNLHVLYGQTGYFVGGSACTPTTCNVIGACCFSGGLCRLISVRQCLQTSGSWKGLNSTCNPHPCDAVVMSGPQGPGGNWYPVGVSGDGGAILVTTSTPTQYAAGVWRASDNWSLLTAPGIASTPRGLTYNGATVVGDLRDIAANTNYRYSGYVWTVGQPNLYAPIHPNLTDAKLLAISPDGSRSVGKFTNNSNITRGAVWSGPAWSFLDLGAMIANSTDTRLNACTNAGRVAGNARIPAGSRAFRDTTLLAGSTPNWAAAMSDNGNVVVGYNTVANNTHAVWWDAAGQPHDIHANLVVPGAGGGTVTLDKSIATDITGDGSTIVGNAWNGTTHFAFIWRADTGMMLLTDYLRLRFNLGGESFTDVTGISDDGRCIVGYDKCYLQGCGEYRSPWVVRLPDARH